MKNRILKLMMIAVTMGAMTAGNIVSVSAAEETTEAQADDSDAELRSQLYGVWPVNLVSYMYMPDGQILDEKGNYLCDYKINGDKIVWDLTNASEDFVGNVKDPEVEIQFLPMDTSKLPKGHENTDYFYAGDNDKMMEIKISQTDDSDPMNPKTAEDIRYSVKSIMDQGSYGKALFYGYTWQTGAGSLSIDKNGDMSLNDGEQTGNLSIDNLNDYTHVSFDWDGKGITQYEITELDADKIVLAKTEDPSQTITLTDKVKLEDE